jgi:hypothetical protein
MGLFRTRKSLFLRYALILRITILHILLRQIGFVSHVLTSFFISFPKLFMSQVWCHAMREVEKNRPLPARKPLLAITGSFTCRHISILYKRRRIRFNLGLVGILWRLSIWYNRKPIAERMGYSDIQINMIYAHLASTHLANAVEKLPYS